MKWRAANIRVCGLNLNRRLGQWDTVERTLSYADETKRWRKEKDAYFGSSDDSPIPHGERHSFIGLDYFEPDERYRLSLNLHRYADPLVVTMVTSKGTQQRFHRYGYFEFEMQGKRVQLQAYRSAERADEHLFVPFRDGTSGKESYGASRYIDLDLSPGDSYILDFNKAYNPYCAYSDDYVCPLPPRENSLDVELRAGEKKYHGR